MSLLGRLRSAASGLVSRRPHQRVSRAVVKTALYRGLMVLVTVVVAFFVTGNTADALSIGFVTNIIKTATYYGYERLWDRISWGV